MSLVRYAFIDALPDALLDAVVANPHGMLRPRADAITALRDALLDGKLPEPSALSWPEPGVRDALLDGLAKSGVVAHCAANPAITHEVLATVLGATAEAQRRVDEMIAQWTLAARELDKRTRRVALLPGPDGTDEALLDEAAWRRIREDAALLAGRAAREALQPAVDLWTEHGDDRAKIRELLESLASASGITATRVPGTLASIDWRTCTELRRMLARVPALRRLVRLLGRQHASQDPSHARALETRGRRVARQLAVDRPVVQELHRVEIRGIERSDEIARMLASEAVLRRIPATKLLWHARRAEHALLAYHADSVATERTLIEQHFHDGVEIEHERAERGPIIILLDTSGSMRGRGEQLAKAVVLQAICVAELEQRACYVYNFSGDGDLVEHEVSDLAHALAFLTLSFGGGTVIGEAMRRALQRLDEERWANADLLVVTDGFLADHDASLARNVDRVRRRVPFQLHVALVPALMPMGGFDDLRRLRDLADHVHDIEAWIDGLGPDN